MISLRWDNKQTRKARGLSKLFTAFNKSKHLVDTWLAECSHTATDVCAIDWKQQTIHHQEVVQSRMPAVTLTVLRTTS